MAKDRSDQHSEEETVRRRDAALRRALTMPPKTHDKMKIGESTPDTNKKKKPAKKTG